MKHLLLAAVLAGGSHASGADPLLRARAWNGFVPGWAVTVWSDGSAELERGAGPTERRRLERAELEALVQVVEQNRPWEIPGSYGEQLIDGPERVIEVFRNGKLARIHLYATSRSLADPKPARGFEAHARALRICEGARRLAAAEWVQECTDKK